MKLREFFDTEDKWCQLFHCKTHDNKPRLLEDLPHDDITKFDIYGAMIFLGYTKKQKNHIRQAIENENRNAYP